MSAIICLTGWIGQDAELKYTASGTPVLSFSLAVNTGFGDNKKTSWWNCNMFGKRAEKLAEHFNKGTHLFVQGTPTIEKYNDKYYTKVFVNDFEFLGNGNKQQADDEAIPF